MRVCVCVCEREIECVRVCAVHYVVHQDRKMLQEAKCKSFMHPP